MSEQIPLLRRLLSEPVVTHVGTYDRITAAGLAPLPTQRPIPIWVGGESPPAYRRIGRLADGWFPEVPPGPKLDEARAMIAEAAIGAGRDPARSGWTAGRAGRTAGIGAFVEAVGRWRDVGATHLTVNTMNASLGSIDRHLEVLAEIAAALDLGPAG